MRFDPPLVAGTLVRRYQRFLADVTLADGRTVTAHCPNTGSMLGCAEPGSPVWLSPAVRPGRRCAWTWELVEPAPGVRVGLHTGRSNHLVREAIERGVIPSLSGYTRIRHEVRYGEGSRIDLLLEADTRPPCYVEVKNVTAAVRGGVALFPDAVTARGARHLAELEAEVGRGNRAVMCFCVQREDVREVRPADQIDPAYGRALRRALAAGVEAMAWRARVSPEGIALDTALPVVCP